MPRKMNGPVIIAGSLHPVSGKCLKDRRADPSEASAQPRHRRDPRVLGNMSLQRVIEIGTEPLMRRGGHSEHQDGRPQSGNILGKHDRQCQQKRREPSRSCARPLTLNPARIIADESPPARKTADIRHHINDHQRQADVQQIKLMAIVEKFLETTS